MEVAGLLLRTFFSLHHAQSAAHHARSAVATPLDETEDAAIAIGASVAAAVISSGAFIEATANEITQSDSRPRKLVRNQPGALLRLNEYLIGSQRLPIDHQTPLWLSAKTLLELRNRLVHYTHDWLDSGTANMIGKNALSRSELLPRMQKEFEFLPVTVIYIPRFLSPNCAIWALNTSIAFLDEFFLRLEQQPSYDHIRYRLDPVGSR